MQNEIESSAPLIDHPVAVFGLLMAVLGLVFYTSGRTGRCAKRFYSIVPPLLLCYFVPGILNSTGIIDGENSPLATVGSRFFLPASLILFTLHLDLREMWTLRKRAGLMFLTGTVGIMLGGPLALWLTAQVAPDVVGGSGPDAVWRGLGALAGSWIGGSANQVALREILQPSPKLFSAIIAADVFVAYVWMAFLLYGAGRAEKMNAFFKADASDVAGLMERMSAKAKATVRIPETGDLILMLALAFGGTGLATLLAEPIAGSMAVRFPELARFSLTNTFFWLILFATAIGIALSFTPARKLENAGASKMGTVLLYMLIATIGMQMDISAVWENTELFLVALLWLGIHALLLLLVGKLLKVPFFYYAVGSMANIGGVASATVTSAAFHPVLVPVGVVLSVFSYAIGTYAGWLTAVLMSLVI